jgi:hypothetical protein
MANSTNTKLYELGQRFYRNGEAFSKVSVQVPCQQGFLDELANDVRAIREFLHSHRKLGFTIAPLEPLE